MDLDPNNPEETMPDARPRQTKAESVLMNLLTGIRLEFKVRGWADHMLTDSMLQGTVADALDLLELYKHASDVFIDSVKK